MKLDTEDKQFVWHPYTQMKDWLQNNGNKVIVRGEDFYLVDSDGNKYLDGIASMWCNVWGHGQNKVTEAMIKQIKFIQHSSLFGLSNEPSITLAENLLKLSKGMDKVFYSDNGSTAIEVALKMALQYYANIGKPEKNNFISIENGYHGDTVAAMSVGYIKKYFGAYKPLLTPVLQAPSPFYKKRKHQDDKNGGKVGERTTTENKQEDDFIENCIEKTENLIKKNSKRCCALIMESGAQIAGGVIIYPQNYQKRISELCKKYDILLILDEIATGFGRLGNMIEYIAQETIPDIACFGKALTAGYFPLAVTLTTNKIFESFLGEYSENKQFYHGHTFTGNPIGCSTAIANIKEYQNQNLIAQIRKNSNHVSRRLKELEPFDIIADIRHKGLLTGIDIEKNGKPIETLKDGQRLNYFIMKESLKMGVYLRSLGNTLMFIPPLAIKQNDLDKIIDVQFKIIEMIESKV
ncbi:MAG TPA: adenosylmethionine--8-amino-7-oxononanoate transaminase [Candidatus Nitrosocosmicus sp.]|nr:adenosylmethionine--8-amino-7-oxononanoate transaminase [Candidatus Nitrosocosmicus sp.]